LSALRLDGCDEADEEQGERRAEHVVVVCANTSSKSRDLPGPHTMASVILWTGCG
jgi:hypothetical protein